MKVKRKFFDNDCEIRKEQVDTNQEIALGAIESAAKKIWDKELVRLRPYRRKRFNVTIESLESGNLFSIAFDICRPVMLQVEALYQCEVEYQGSRSFGEIKHVMEDYEEVTRFCSDFFTRRKLAFEAGYLSKLTYIRQYS